MKKYKFVKQDGMKDCGVACLLMIIRTFGGDCSKEYLRDLTNTTKDGTTAYDLLETGKKFHFTTFGLKGKLKDLSDNYFPLIAHVIKDEVYHHFVVIYEINKKKNKLTIADPSLGIFSMKIEEFEKITTNQFLIFIQEGATPKIITKNHMHDLIINFFRSNWKIILILTILSFVYTITSIISSFYLQVIINFNVFDSLIVYLITAFIIVSLIQSFSRFFRVHLFVKFINYLEFILFKNIYHHLFYLPNTYYQNRTTGEILSRITDLASIKGTLTNFFFTVFVDIFLAIISCPILFFINVHLTCIVILLIFLETLFFTFFKKRLIKTLQNLKEKYAIFNSYLVDTLSSISMIRHLNQESYIESVFNKKYDVYQKESIRYQNLHNLELLVKNLIQSIFNILLITFGVFLISKGVITLPTFISYMFLLSFFLEPIDALFIFLLDYQDSKEAINRIQELYQVEEEEPPESLKSMIQTIEVHDLSFSYRKGQEAFTNQNIKLSNGEKVLIYGSSGCGKSTLGRILSGYENRYTGDILVNNQLVPNSYNSSFRKHVTYVGQEDGLLALTLRENIIMGRNVTDEEFEEVCKICRVDKIASNHILGYDMLLEEDGNNLSSGERQRVILARSLLKRCEVYLFDESLCNLDIGLEREILKDLFMYLAKKIVIIISHRFYNEDLYDRKICFQKGVNLCKEC